MNPLLSILVLALQRVPYVNRLSFVRDAGTIEAALKSLTKAFGLISNVAANQRAAETDLTNLIATLNDDRIAVVAGAEKAERVAKRLAALLD